MNYCVDIGHNLPGIDTGATSGTYKEDYLNYAVGTKLINNLLKDGDRVINSLNRARRAKTNTLQERCNASNDGRADLFISIHHNKTAQNIIAQGVEVWYLSEAGKKVAINICAEIEKLGFKNRGAKKAGVDGKNLYVLSNTKAVAVLVEVCFINKDSDMQRWDGDNIAGAISKALTGKSSNKNKNNTIDEVKNLQIFCNKLNIKDAIGRELIVDGLLGTNTMYCLDKLLEYLREMKGAQTR